MFSFEKLASTWRRSSTPPPIPCCSTWPAPARRSCAALTHETFLAIHPYLDGNGRTARLLLNLQTILQYEPHGEGAPTARWPRR